MHLSTLTLNLFKMFIKDTVISPQVQIHLIHHVKRTKFKYIFRPISTKSLKNITPEIMRKKPTIALNQFYIASPADSQLSRRFN